VKRIVGLFIFISACVTLAVPSGRAFSIECGRIAMNASMAVFDSAKKLVAVRRECLKRHEAPLDHMDSRLDTATQQDKLYKAME
jgi:hypothetical protein